MVTPAASVSHGTTVTVTCDSGYPLVGNTTAVCDNGDFMAVPSCGFRLTGNVPTPSFILCKEYSVSVKEQW